MSEGQAWAPLDAKLGNDYMYGPVWVRQGHTYANVDTGLVHGPSRFVYFDRDYQIGKITSLGETVEGIIAHVEINDDRFLKFLMGEPTEFSIREPYIVEPDEDVEAKRLVERWGSDCEVPTYVIEEFKDFLAEHLEIPRAYLESEV